MFKNLTKEGRNATDDQIINENQKWFKIYRIAPEIISITLMVLSFIWSIVDVATFQFYNGYYGIMSIRSAFGALLIWWIIGAVLSISAYFVSKIKISAKILEIQYLNKISEK